MKVAPPKNNRELFRIRARLQKALPPVVGVRRHVLVYPSRFGWVARVIVVRPYTRRSCP